MSNDFSTIRIIIYNVTRLRVTGAGRTRGPSHVRGRRHQRQVDRRLRVVGRQLDHMGHTYGRRQTPVDGPSGTRDVRQAQRRRVCGPVGIRRQAHNRVGHETRRRAHVAPASPAHTRPIHVHGRNPGRGPSVRQPILTDHAADEHAGAVRQSAGVHQPR